MDIEHAEIRLQPPPAPVQHLEALELIPSPPVAREQAQSDELLMMGMMLWMEQGLVLEWLSPKPERFVEEQEKKKTAK
jgi:hypothetical protein